MTQYLPPNLLALFAPREPIPYKEPPVKEPHDKKRVPILGIAQYVNLFEEPLPVSPKPERETREQKKKRKRKERQELQAYKIEQGIALWNPHENKTATTDPYRTLFVGSINYDTSESKLKREFEQFGSIKRIKMITHNKSGKARGYAFVEYEKERDMHSAYKRADGMKIDGKRVLVDVERGRTVKGWLPRRFGGGVGEGRKARSPGYRSASRAVGGPSNFGGGRDRGGGGGARDRDRGRDAGRGGDRDRDSRGGDRDRRDRGDRDRGGERERRDDRSRGDRNDAKRPRREDFGGNPNHVPIGGRPVAAFGGIKSESNGH